MTDRLHGRIPLFINPTGRVAGKRWLGDALRTRWNRCARQALGVHVPMYEGTKHSTATDAIRRGVSLEQIQAALRHADGASTRVYAKLARGGAFDILRNPARVSHLHPAENRSKKTSENNGLRRADGARTYTLRPQPRGNASVRSAEACIPLYPDRAPRPGPAIIPATGRQRVAAIPRVRERATLASASP